MATRQTKSILTTLFLTTLCAPSYGQEVELSEATRGMLLELDSAIANAQSHIQDKEKRLSWMKEGYSRLTTKQMMDVNEKLYEEYKVYDSDSAFKYIDINIALADQIGDKSLDVDYKLKKTFVLAATGLIAESLETLDDIGRNPMTKAQKTEYYSQKMYTYSHMDQLNKYEGNYTRKMAESNDSVMKYIDSGNPLYPWYLGWDKMNNNGDLGDVTALLDSLLASPDGLDTREYAMNAYLLARIKQLQADDDGFVRYLALSGIADIRSCNKDIASIEELGYWMYRHGHLDKAFMYLNFCFDKAQQYNNRVRLMDISKTIKEIQQHYMTINEQQEHRLNAYLTSLALFAVALIATIILLVMQMRKVRTSKQSLTDVNGRLKENIDKLSESSKQMANLIDELNATNEKLNKKNDELKESNFLKEEYIGYVFSLCNSYLKKMDDYRLAINRKLRVGQTQDVVKMTSSTKMIEDEAKEFLNEFDTFFLNLYPTFVSDFNKLLRPEEQIATHDEGQLNTVLRIYALVRLGINDSVKIAEFLHCSAQTVYNNRLKTRNKSIIAKEEFLSAVQNLGRAGA